VLTVPARPDIVRNPGRGNRYALNTPGSSKSTGPFSGPPLFQEQNNKYYRQQDKKQVLPGTGKGNKDGLLHGLIRRALGLPGGFSGW